MSQEIEELMKRVQAKKGVVGALIINNEGIAIKTTFEDDILTVHYAGVMHRLAEVARSVVLELKPDNELLWLRLRTTYNEILLHPSEDYVLVVIQKQTF